MYISVLNLSLLLYLYHKSVPSMKISDSPSKKCHQSSKDSNWTHQGIKTNHRGRERERERDFVKEVTSSRCLLKVVYMISGPALGLNS